MKPKARRFDPWGGVTRPMIEAEAKHVAREMEDYLLLSLNDLKDRLKHRNELWNQVDGTLHEALTRLPERAQFAIQCLLVRDLMFLMELYLEYVRNAHLEETPPMQPAEAPRAPFSEWLFETDPPSGPP